MLLISIDFFLSYNRVYNGLAHEELSKLDTSSLIDEFEQSLISMTDYKRSLKPHYGMCRFSVAKLSTNTYPSVS